MKLLIHPAVDAVRLRQIHEAASGMVILNVDVPVDARREIVDADAFFGKITPELLAVAGQLKWVQSPTASLEHYLFPELIEHPCLLSNMRGLFSDVIADHVMGYVLCFARNLHLYLRRQMEARWAPVGNEDMTEQTFVTGPATVSPVDASHIHLSDATIGVVGAGCIGQEVCRRAAAFGMKVVAAPHTPATYKLFRTAQFEQMKSSAYLINIGRGVIVDLEDVTSALEHGLIAGVALDVFEIEPLPASHRLWKMENAILTPHIAAASPRIAERHLETLLENIRCFANGMPPGTLVDKSQWF